MLQLTSRDEAMLDWMNVVRLADVDAIRWALSAYQDDHDGPVSVRRANHWIARMAELGYLGRIRPVYRDRQIVWPTYRSSGRSAPALMRQTMRHEIALAAVSARFVAEGFAWTRDRDLRHNTDGIATCDDRAVLLEVELTSKTRSRYMRIFEALADRISKDSGTVVVYCCTAEVANGVRHEADRAIFREIRPHFLIHGCLDMQGRVLDEFFPDAHGLRGERSGLPSSRH